MSQKPKLKPDDPAEYARFLETAKQVEAEDDAEVFERAFKTVVLPKAPQKDAPKERP